MVRANLINKKTSAKQMNQKNSLIIIFNKYKSPIIDGQYDDIWILPHHKELNQCYLQEIYNTTVNVLPYIWDDIFIKKYNQELYKNLIKKDKFIINYEF